MKKSLTGSPVARRATVLAFSPERKNKQDTKADNDGTPSSWKNKSKSQGHLLLDQPIANLEKLELEAEQVECMSLSTRARVSRTKEVQHPNRLLR